VGRETKDACLKYIQIWVGKETDTLTFFGDISILDADRPLAPPFADGKRRRLEKNREESSQGNCRFPRTEKTASWNNHEWLSNQEKKEIM
jgi:hypothetical protein